jgi:Virulence factor BrkB
MLSVTTWGAMTISGDFARAAELIVQSALGEAGRGDRSTGRFRKLADSVQRTSGVSSTPRMPARCELMWRAGRTAKKIFKQPGAFALAVIRQFRANQGVLLAGAVAYYTLLSLVPLLILILMALSHVIPEDRLLLTLSEYLEFVVPGQSTALVEEVRTFLVHKQVVGGILFLTMLFF